MKKTPCYVLTYASIAQRLALLIEGDTYVNS